MNSFNERKKDTILANPLVIENVSNDFLEITYNNKVPLQLYAKNPSGKWQYITYPYQSFCATGVYENPFFPGEIVVTSIPVFDGNISTVGRFRIYDYWSDEFPINLEKEIFINPFEARNSKDETE